MGGHYEKDMYRQLEELMNRVDVMSQELKDSHKKFQWELKTQEIKLREEFRQERLVLNNRISELEEMLVVKDEQIRLLTNDNERMKAIINHNSNNSSLPPSTDQKVGKPSNTYNGRKKSMKSNGGQKGHPGKTLTKKDVEAKIASKELIHKIECYGKKRGDYVSKYVLDLQVIPIAIEKRFYADKDGKIKIPNEYRSDVTYGSSLKAIAVNLYSEGVVSNDRIREFLNSISGNKLSLSVGSIYNFCRDFSEKAALGIVQIETELMNAKTIYTDGTTVSVNGIQNYIRNQSTSGAVLYCPMEKKNIPSTLVHDHETALYYVGSAHAECNVHLLRYLRKNTEEAKNTWSTKMAELFCEMNNERKERISAEMPFHCDEIEKYEMRYKELIEEGKAENKNTGYLYAKKDEKALLNRLEKYKANHLLFLHDFDIDFSNNLSERDLRKCKNRQKMAGGFRTQDGNKMYCTILSIVETCKRKGMPLLENICKVFQGTPAIF